MKKKKYASGVMDVTTEDRIIIAFKEMARHQGLYAVRMEDLAARAGITKKTIYAYFAGKKELIEKAVNSFMAETTYEVESIMNKTGLVEMISTAEEAILKEGAFLLNTQSLRDLQVYYPEIWQQFLEFRIKTIGSVVEVIYARSKKKWLQEIDKSVMKEAFLAINSRFFNPDFAVETGLPSEELSLQMAKLFIYPYL